MPDKLTDKEIVKAKELIRKLEEAYNDYYDTTKSMPYDIDTTVRESAICLENCLNKINRLKAKVEYYKKNRNKYQDDVMYLSKQCDMLEEEIDRLKAENERLYGDIMCYKLRWARATVKLDTAKTEAYKEFAERLKQWACRIVIGSASSEHHYVREECIDNLLKELVGEDNEMQN